MYAATLVAEVPVIVARMFVALAVAVVVLLIKNHSAAGADGYMELAWIPTGWSILALITTVALRLPSLWFVVDEPQPDAAVCGDALMLSRGLLESEHLAAVLAHELGHLATSDGKLTAAINRLIINPLPRLRQRKERPGSRVILAGNSLLLTVTLFGALLWAARWMIWFARGGLGLMILSPFWGSYWREREYTADQYAASLGQAEELADFLEVHALINDHPVPFIWLTEHTHPPSELWIDRLRKTSAQTFGAGSSGDGTRQGRPSGAAYGGA